jgi:hypothetical protein
MWLNGYPRLHGYSMWWMFISHVPMEVALVIGSSLEIDSVAREQMIWLFNSLDLA